MIVGLHRQCKIRNKNGNVERLVGLASMLVAAASGDPVTDQPWVLVGLWCNGPSGAVWLSIECTCPWMKSVRHLIKQMSTSSRSKIGAKGPRSQGWGEAMITTWTERSYLSLPGTPCLLFEPGSLVSKILDCLVNEA